MAYSVQAWAFVRFSLIARLLVFNYSGILSKPSPCVSHLLLFERILFSPTAGAERRIVWKFQAGRITSVDGGVAEEVRGARAGYVLLLLVIY